MLSISLKGRNTSFSKFLTTIFVISQNTAFNSVVQFCWNPFCMLYFIQPTLSIYFEYSFLQSLNFEFDNYLRRMNLTVVSISRYSSKVSVHIFVQCDYRFARFYLSCHYLWTYYFDFFSLSIDTNSIVELKSHLQILPCCDFDGSTRFKLFSVTSVACRYL